MGSTPTSGTLVNPWPDREIAKVYGPYRRKHKNGKDRNQVVFTFVDGSRSSMSNARWIMTQHLGRVLGKHEEVDHIDENPLNDSIENLQLLTPLENNQKSHLGRPSPFRGVEKGWTHGTVYGFMHKKCDCQLCLTAKRVWNDERNAARRKPGGYGKRKRPVTVEVGAH